MEKITKKELARMVQEDTNEDPCNDGDLIVSDRLIRDMTLDNRHLWGITFRACEFENVIFKGGPSTEFCGFNQCSFDSGRSDCSLLKREGSVFSINDDKSTFRECRFSNSIIMYCRTATFVNCDFTDFAFSLSRMYSIQIYGDSTKGIAPLNMVDERGFTAFAYADRESGEHIISSHHDTLTIKEALVKWGRTTWSDDEYDYTLTKEIANRYYNAIHQYCAENGIKISQEGKTDG